jgi:hypothetical protein
VQIYPPEGSAQNKFQGSENRNNKFIVVLKYVSIHPFFFYNICKPNKILELSQKVQEAF